MWYANGMLILNSTQSHKILCLRSTQIVGVDGATTAVVAPGPKPSFEIRRAGSQGPALDLAWDVMGPTYWNWVQSRITICYSVCQLSSYQISYLETCRLAPRTHELNTFPLTFTQFLQLVPRDGTPQLEQSGARCTRLSNGIWSKVHSTNLKQSLLAPLYKGPVYEKSWSNKSLNSWNSGRGQPTSWRVKIHSSMEISVIGSTSIPSIVPQIKIRYGIIWVNIDRSI